jgi:Ataxin-3
VVPTNPDNPLPQTDADLIAVSLPSRASSEAQHSSTPYSPHPSAGFGDEDLELQAALQASLGGPAVRLPMPQPHVGPVAGGTRAISPVPGPNIGFPTSPSFSPPPVPHPSTRPVNQPMANPVAASMARNQVVLERMRREQEAALREHYHDEVSRFEQMPTGSMSRSGMGGRVHEEEEQLRRAIAASEDMARGQGPELGRAQMGSDDAGARAGSDNTQQAEALGHGRLHGGRVYDDEDAEFQAALQASLETAPPGIHTPTPPRASDSPMRRSPLPAATSRAAPRLGTELPSNDANVHDDGDDDDDLYYDDDEDTATEETLSETAAEPQEADDVSMEEMRRRRLARFGAGPQT